MTQGRTEWARRHKWLRPGQPFDDQAGWSLRQPSAGVPEPLSLIAPGFTYLVVDGQRPGVRSVHYRLRVLQAKTALVNSIGEAHRIAVGIGVQSTMREFLLDDYTANKASKPMPQHFIVWTIDEDNVDPITDAGPLPADVQFDQNTGWVELPAFS